jgi:hypothetical protein
MIEATTYLFAGAALVPLDDVREPPKRLNYIEGAIELSIDGHPIITKDEWDLVDQLWAYLVNAVQRVAAGRDAQMPFPDTPIDVTFALDAASDTVTVTLSYKTLPVPRRATAPRAELVRRICELARGVFEKLYALVPDARFQRVLDQIREVLPG